LHGQGPRDFVELVTEAGAIMLEQAKIVKTHEEGVKRIQQAIADGSGFEKQKALFKAQGGDISYLEHPEKFPVAKHIIAIKAEKEGYVKRIDSMAIGVSAMKLGAGRATMQDVIDMSAGIVLGKKVGDKVHKGDVVATAYTNKEGIQDVLKDIHDAFELSKEEVVVHPIVHAYIHK
jgi:pyrimidine-nucleoside phosphorylase